MKYNGAVFLDYDGTLVDEKENIFTPTQKVRNAIKQLQKKGYLVCLATGRSLCYGPDASVNFDGYIAANGAYSCVDGEIISNLTFSKELYNKALEEFSKRNLQFSFENQDFFYANDVNGENFLKMLDVFSIGRDNLRHLKELDISTINKALVAFDNVDQLEELRTLFQNELVFDRHRDYFSADVTLHSINKGIGVLNVIKKLEIPFENTYAFGDGTNDVEMLKAVRHGVAMGICADEARSVAEYVTDTVINEGVPNALKHYGIIS